MSKLRVFESPECKKIQKFLDDFLSGELSIETNQELLHHLDHCSRCREMLEFRQDLRSRLKESWNSVEIPEQLAVRVKRSVTGDVSLNPFFLRIAAGILLAILALPGGYLAWQAVPPHLFPYHASVIDHYGEVASDHLDCHGKPAQHHRLPLDRFENLIEAKLSETDQNFKLVAVQECQRGDANLIHYIFKGRTGRLSLVLENRNRSQTLRKRQDALVTRLQGVDVQAVLEGSLVVAAMESPSHFIYLVADQFDTSQTLGLTETVLPSLKSALIGLS